MRSIGSSRPTKVTTTLLQARPPWVTTSSWHPTASDRGEDILAMLFWVLAALAIVGVLAIVWGLYFLVLYFLVHRLLEQPASSEGPLLAGPIGPDPRNPTALS